MLKKIMDLLCRLAGCNRSKRRAQSVLEIAPAVEFGGPHMVRTKDTVKLGDSVRPVFLCNGSRKLPHVLTERNCFVPLTWKR
jgi:hypothetical protein